MKKYVLIPLLALSAVVSCMAAHVTPDMVLQVAKNYYFSVATQTGDIHYASLNPEIIYSRVENGSPIYHVVTFPGYTGYVMVSGDDSYIPVIGYSTEGPYPVSVADQPPAFVDWMNSIRSDILLAATRKANPAVKAEWNHYSTYSSSLTDAPLSAVAPLTTTLWSQGCNFNSSCPATGGTHPAGPCDHVVTGCVATAMAQVMKYWNFPEHGTGSNSYTDPANTGDPSYGTLYANFNTTYNWSNMPDAPANTSNGIQTLMYHCGVSVEMDYAYNSSGAWSYGSSDVADAFKNYFYYSNTASDIQKSSYTEAAWITVLKGQLNLDRVICYGNHNHAWVVDGYSDNYNGTGTTYFHMNWGWGGSSNGYFALADAGTNQECVINIFPTSQPPIAPTQVTATQATYANKVRIDWHWASNATYYRVYRNTVNNSGTSTAISSWQTSLTFDDLTAYPGNTYYYWVKSATSAAGASASGYSTFAQGYTSTPGSLTSNSQVTISASPTFYYFANNNYWNVVGARSVSVSDDWDVYLYSAPDFPTPYWAGSSLVAGMVDFVVMDGNHTGSSVRGIKATRYSGSGNAYLEFEGGTDILYSTSGPYNNLSWGSSDVVKVWDVYLTAGTYGIVLEANSGSFDPGIAFYSSSSGTYYSGRTGNSGLADANGNGAGEQIMVTVGATDYYGLVVWSNNTSSGNFNLRVERVGTWTGLVSHDWNNPSNWSGDVVPDATMDVTIPSGTPNECWIYTTDAVCNNLTINASTYLRNYDELLTVSGNLTINGQLMMDNAVADAQINIMGDVIWNAGSTAWISDNTLIRAYGYWTFNAGANAHLNAGGVLFPGSSTAYIRNYESNCWFNDVGSYKTGGALLGLSAMSTDTLNIHGHFYIHPGAQFNLYSSYPVELNGTFYNNGQMYCTNGTFIYKGSGQNIKQNAGDYFHNLVIQASGPTYAVTNLDVNNDFTLLSGSLVSNNYTLRVGGNWSNPAGPAAFAEGTSRVIFDGGNYHQYIYGDENFYILELNKTAGGALRVPTDSVWCFQYDWTAGAIDVFQGSFVAGDLADNGIFGAWYLNPGGIIDISNYDGYVDLNGELHIFGGAFTVHGGTSDTYWPYSANATIEMSGGTLDFTDRGILVYDTPTYSLAENITGGWIRTPGSVRVDRADFTPSGGIFEMHGPSEGTLHTLNGSNLYHLIIDKGAVAKQEPAQSWNPADIREGDKNQGPSDVNGANVDNILDINGNLLINSGILRANTNTIYVAGNWTNLAGTGGFDEGQSQVIFDGAAAADITTAESFFDVILNKTYSGYTGLELNEDVFIMDNLEILDGTMELNAPTNLTVGNHILISSGSGLNADDTYGPIITVGGNWTDYNTGYSSTFGFNPGNYSTVVFSSSTTSPQVVTSINEETFNHLEINGSYQTFSPHVNLVVKGNVNLINGNWEDDIAGLTHTLLGNFNATTNGHLITTWIPNTFEFAGPSEAFINHPSTLGYFRHIIINKSFLAAKPNLPGEDDPQQPPSDNPLVNNQTVTLLSNITCQQAGALIIQEGIFDLNNYYFGGTGNVSVEDGGTLKVNGTSDLAVGTNHELNVYSGGMLEILGDFPGAVDVSRTGSGSFGFNIQNNGSIKAENVDFQYLNGNGVFLMDGSHVDPVHSFHNCSFNHGAASPSAMFAVSNNADFVVNNASFPTNTWGGQYNAWKPYNQGHITFIGATGAFAGPAFEYDPYDRIDWLNALSGNATATPSTVCLGSTSQLQATPGGGLPGYTYLWLPTTGLSDPNIANPVANPATTTTYSVVIHDAFGNMTSPTVTVTVAPNPVANAGTDVTINSGGSTTLSGAASSGTAPYTYSWTPVTGLSNALIPNPVASPLVTTTYTLAVSDNLGCVSTDDVVVTVLPGGSYIVDGFLRYDNTATTPLHNCTLTLQNGSGPVSSTVTDASGSFSFTGVTPDSYYITSQTSKPWGGGNSTDALIAMQHFVHILTLSGIRLEAANVDAVGLVNSNDALLIMKRYVALVNSFPAGDWTFETPAFDVISSNITQNIKGLCYGDVNASFIPPAQAPIYSLQDYSEITYQPGDIIRVPVHGNQAISLSALSLTFSFPDDHFDITGISSPDHTTLCYSVQEGVVRVAWYSLTPLEIPACNALFTVELRMKPKGLHANGIPLITQLSDMELADGMGMVITPFSLTQPILRPSTGPRMVVRGNNPARDRIHLELDLPESGQITIAIYNELGVPVASSGVSSYVQAGIKSIDLNTASLAAGVYLVKVRLQGEEKITSEVRKWVIIK